MGQGFILSAEPDILNTTVAKVTRRTQVYKLNPDFN